jgi:4-amino-4-deoxy-L-arabinose transferase-like glycosyltransferase
MLPRSTESLTRQEMGLVMAVALVARVGYVVAFMRGYVPNSDADSYYAIGRSVSQGHGYAFTLPFEFVHATAIRPPLYPTVIAAAFRVFGAHVGVAQGVNIAAGCGVALLGALIADRIGGPRAGPCAGLVIALYPTMIANDVTVLVESLAVLLVLATVLFLVDGRTVLAGVTLGLLMLDRASAQWFVAIVAVWVVWRFGWRHAARLVIVALVVVAPWIIRNAVNVGGSVLVATNGYNLNAIYSNEAVATPDGFVDAYFDKRFALMRIASIDEVDLDARLRSNALGDLRARPTRVFHVAWVNAEHWFELRPSLNALAERLDGRNLRVRHWTLPFFYLISVAGLVALVRARRSAAAQLLALAAGYFTFVCLVSIAVPRLRSIFDASLAIGAGIALSWLFDRRATVDARPPTTRTMRLRHNAIALGMIGLALVVGALVWRADTHRQARSALVSALARDDTAIESLTREYHQGEAADQPPQLQRGDLNRVRDLMTVLGDRAPQVPRSLRTSVGQALRSVRVVSHEADVIGLLSVGEELRASADKQKPSLNAVRKRYEDQIRPGDPTLESWRAVTTGHTLTLASSALRNLSAALR